MRSSIIHTFDDYWGLSPARYVACKEEWIKMSVLKSNQRSNFYRHERIMYMFFWVFPRRQIVVGRSFVTLCQFNLQRLHPAFEDGTDTGFRNVGQLQSDAGEIPKRTYTIFKSRQKFEIKNCFILLVCIKSAADFCYMKPGY